MMNRAFLDELSKLAAAGQFPLSALVVERRAPLNSIGALVRGALHKRASDLAALADEVAPPAIEVQPGDASTRSRDGGKAPSLIRPGLLGAVTPSADPIDLERFNRVWREALR